MDTVLELQRDICNQLSASETREWLVTNGIGGYACGSIAGVLTRHYHGLLIAALKPPLERTLLLTKLDEQVQDGDNFYGLHCDRWASGMVTTHGYQYIDEFHLEGTVPTWQFAWGKTRLQKQVWLEQGANTTYVRYTLQQGTQPIALSIKALVNYRDHHGHTQGEGWQMQIEPRSESLKVQAFDQAQTFYLFAPGATIAPSHIWYKGYNLAMETYRGLYPYDDHLMAATMQVNLSVGESFTLVASTSEAPDLDGAAALARQHAHEAHLQQQWTASLQPAAASPVAEAETASEPMSPIPDPWEATPLAPTSPAEAVAPEAVTSEPTSSESPPASSTPDLTTPEPTAAESTPSTPTPSEPTPAESQPVEPISPESTAVVSDRAEPDFSEPSEPEPSESVPSTPESIEPEPSAPELSAPSEPEPTKKLSWFERLILRWFKPRRPEPQSVPEPEPAIQPEPESESISEPMAVSEPEPETTSEPEITPELEIAPEPEITPEPEISAPVAVSEPELESLPDSDITSEPEIAPEPEPELILEPESLPEAESEITSAPESESASTLETDPTPIPCTEPEPVPITVPAWVEHLVLAVDQFVVDRAVDGEPGKTVIAGYPWFGDWGRDTMIALPGIAIAAGRPELAKPILETFARYLDQGMLPNVFPEAGTTPNYNTVDATLWYFEAIRAYWAATADAQFVADLFPKLVEVIEWHQKGTRYNIHVEADGLLYAGESGVQLTWMDAKIGDWVVTPRTGKPVEINALWYNALRIMQQLAEVVGQSATPYQELAETTRQSFQRFWSDDLGYCYDVLDSPNGDDVSLRPNQVFAIALPNTALNTPSLLTPKQQESVLAVVQENLVAPYGLRSLAPSHPSYQGHYGGDPLQRDSSYHQGPVWGWLIGPFVQAHLQVHQDPAAAIAFLEPMAEQLSLGCVGNLSEIFDGDAPHAPRGAFAQAWTVAEVLRTYRLAAETAAR